MRPDVLGSAWRGLTPATSATELEAAPIAESDGVWVAVDHLGGRHLLLRVPEGSSLPASRSRGLEAVVAQHRVSGQPDASYCDVSCTTDELLARFEVVAADLASVAIERGAADRVAAIAASLSQWRWFWGVDPEDLGSTDAVGLLGELWFMTQWAGVSEESVAAWTASEGSRHDFQWPERSVEVKTTSKAGSAVHRISPISQLEDPEAGRLYLFSLRVSRDRLARNTLASLVDAVLRGLAGEPESLALFLERVSARGYTPASQRAVEGYRVVDESLYRVDGTFPRLTEASLGDRLPEGVGGLSYELDMTVCGPWLEATQPEGWRKAEVP